MSGRLYLDKISDNVSKDTRAIDEFIMTTDFYYFFNYSYSKAEIRLKIPCGPKLY